MVRLGPAARVPVNGEAWVTTKHHAFEHTEEVSPLETVRSRRRIPGLQAPGFPHPLAGGETIGKDLVKDGVFDPEYYQRLLAAHRTKPHQYEEQRREELLIEKARLLVSEATTLTPAELQEVKDLNARQTLEGAESDPVVFEQIKMQFVLQKKQRAMQAFQAMLRARGDVTIHEELL